MLLLLWAWETLGCAAIAPIWAVWGASDTAGAEVFGEDFSMAEVGVRGTSGPGFFCDPGKVAQGVILEKWGSGGSSILRQ